MTDWEKKFSFFKKPNVTVIEHLVGEHVDSGSILDGADWLG